MEDESCADCLGYCVWKDGRDAQIMPKPKGGGGGCTGPIVRPISQRGEHGVVRREGAIEERMMCPLD